MHISTNHRYEIESTQKEYRIGLVGRKMGISFDINGMPSDIITQLRQQNRALWWVEESPNNKSEDELSGMGSSIIFSPHRRTSSKSLHHDIEIKSILLDSGKIPWDDESADSRRQLFATAQKQRKWCTTNSAEAPNRTKRRDEINQRESTPLSKGSVESPTFLWSDHFFRAWHFCDFYEMVTNDSNLQ